MTLEAGSSAPEFKLEDYRGQHVGLNDLDNYDGVLVVFMCNHCPYVKAQVDELKKLDSEYPSIAVVGINPNAETHPMDSMEKMQDLIEENDLDIYYLADPGQEVAKAYGAECTPDPFLLDWNRNLYFHSRLNDATGPDSEPEERYMKNAIDRMLKRKAPPEESKPPQGCSIKWKE